MGPEITGSRLPLPQMSQQSNSKPLEAVAKLPSEYKGQDKSPSLAQYAINQMVNRAGATEFDKLNRKPEPESKEAKPGKVSNGKAAARSVNLNTTPTSTPPLQPRAMNIFKDMESGQFVTIVRDLNTGEVSQQVPDNKALEYYSRVEQQLEQFLENQRSNAAAAVSKNTVSMDT